MEVSLVFPVEKMNFEDTSTLFWEQYLCDGSQTLPTDVVGAVFFTL